MAERARRIQTGVGLRCISDGGEPLPALETAAIGDADDLVPALIEAASDLGITVCIVDADDWKHGGAKGVCTYRSLYDLQPIVEAKDRPNRADLAVTLIHEYAHALLHFDVEDGPKRAKREVEAEAVAYIVGRSCGLDTGGSAFYLAAWESDDSEVIRKRLGRISSTARKIIGLLDE